LVLLDLGLPRIDGREALEGIWGDRRLRQIPVMSSRASTRTRT
jgi:CheY-like chemotaxis protein